MVPGGVGDDTMLFLLVAKLRYSIKGATKLKGADPLKIFTLQKDFCSHRFVEGSGSHNRGDIGMASQSLSCCLDELKHSLPHSSTTPLLQHFVA
jgi:hypothetical protein